ncbi:MAG TPA: tetratricopeptide repeat protein, partial [Nitrospiria bacterium]|nr:tetratricopeptide repeat protein [Nitrospiria bacterium]
GCVVLALMGMEQLKKGRRVILRKAGPGVLFVSLTLMLGFFALESRERNRTWEDPVSFWDAAAAGAPNAAYPNEQLGIFLGRAGKLDEAERSFKRALQSNPEQERRGKILSNLGDLYSRQGRYRDAAETLRKSLKYKPEDDEILWHLGELYFQLSVVEQDPNETGVDSGRRVTRFDPDLFREGEGYFQKALALRPILFLYNRLGWKYVEFGEFEKAENHFSHVMDAGVRLDSDLGREAVRGLAAIQKERKK